MVLLVMLLMLLLSQTVLMMILILMAKMAKMAKLYSYLMSYSLTVFLSFQKMMNYLPRGLFSWLQKISLSRKLPRRALAAV